MSQQQPLLLFLLALLAATLVVSVTTTETTSSLSSSSSSHHLYRRLGSFKAQQQSITSSNSNNQIDYRKNIQQHLLVGTLRGGAASRSSSSSSSSAAVKKRASSTITTSKPAVTTTPTTTTGGGGTASIPNEIFNLVKAIVGAGVLGLPAGIAAFGNAPSALYSASVLILLTGILSGFGFWLIGVTCAATNTQSYRTAWAQAVSPQTSWIPTLGCLLVTSFAVTGYSMILSDTAPLLLAGAFGITISRTQALLGVTLGALLPLCLMKNLKSLSPFSLVGISGVAYTFFAMAMRYLTGAYDSSRSSSSSGNSLLSQVASHLQPKFGTKGAASIFHPNAFVLLSMLSTAYVSHYNAPRFYLELRNHTIPRYTQVVVGSFGTALLIFLGIATFGFLTFGEGSAGFILNNYAKHDTWMSWSRLAVALSILFSYPLAFVGVRDGVLDILQVPTEKRTDSFLNVATIALLSLVTAAAYVTKDIRFLMALSGSSFGNAITYLFPTFMILSLALRNQKSIVSPSLDWVKSKPMLLAAGTTGILGLVMAVVGLSRALTSL